MPLYLFHDEAGHEREEFVIHADNKGCRTHICRHCGNTMAPVMAFGQGLCYFEEGRSRRIFNLERCEKDAQGRPIATKPVYVTSHEQQNRLMHQQGLAQASRGRGYPGQWL